MLFQHFDKYARCSAVLLQQHVLFNGKDTNFYGVKEASPTCREYAIAGDNFRKDFNDSFNYYTIKI